MEDPDAELAALDHPRLAVRHEALSELREHFFPYRDLEDPAAAARIVGGLARLIGTSPRAAPFAAALVFELIATARAANHAAVITAAAALDSIDETALPAGVRDALVAARRIRDGGAVPDEDALADVSDAATACDRGSPATATDVVAWCRGGRSVGDTAPNVVVPLLVEVALTCDVALEPVARAGIRDDGDYRAGVILGEAHRAIFHAVLAWRTGRPPAFPPAFPAHREHDRALAHWVAVMADRDPALCARLVALLGCTTVDEVRAREAKHELGTLDFPEGDVF